MRRRLSSFALLWAVLQLVLPLGLTFADAALADESSGRSAYAHIEEQSGDGCQPIHSGECIVCRYLTGSVGMRGALAAAEWTSVAAHTPRAEPRDAFAGALRDLPLSRAPPLA